MRFNPARRYLDTSKLLKKRYVRARLHRALRLEFLEQRRVLASEWQNTNRPMDVNANGIVTPIDAIIVINELNKKNISFPDGTLPPPNGILPPPFYDVSGNGRIDPIDALRIINLLNRGAQAPSIQSLGLAMDTAAQGTFNNDAVSSIAILVGQVTDADTPIQLLEIQIDEGIFQALDFDASGNFHFDPNLARDGSADGPHTVHLRATDTTNRQSITAEFEFVLDTISPVVSTNFPDIIRTQSETISVHFTESLPSTALAPSNFALTLLEGPNAGDTIPISSVTQEPGNTVRIAFRSLLANHSYRLSFNDAVADVAGNRTNPTLIEFQVAQPTLLIDVSPAPGEQLISLTRETVIRFDRPVDPDTITPASFYLTAAGTPVTGQIRVSPTELFATLFYDEPLPASTRVNVFVDGDLIKGRDGIALDANSDYDPGGVGTFAFETLPMSLVPNTSVWGYVYDSYNQLPQELAPISVPVGDAQFDPSNSGLATIPFARAEFFSGTGDSPSNPRLHPNRVTSFLDSSMIYGSDESRGKALRTFDGTGRLKLSEGGLLPINDLQTFPSGLLAVDNKGSFANDQLPVAGDIRASESPGLTAMHTLFVREHNRKADELSSENPTWNDNLIYENARRWVSALLQHIAYQEYLPTLLGPNAIPNYSGFKPDVDPSVSTLFSSAAFRLGHSQQSAEILRIDESGMSLSGGSINIRDAFFNPLPVKEDGIDPYLRGLLVQPAEEIDTKIVEDLRNFLFGLPGAGGLDLAAIGIQRGRDMGLPSYVQTREQFGLPAIDQFAQITSNPVVAAQLQMVYGTVDKVDMWVGGFAEDHVPDGSVGALFAEIIADQFLRSRDGDRFWYENGQLDQTELVELLSTTMADVLERNSGLTNLPLQVFISGTAPQGPDVFAVAGDPKEYRALDGSGNHLTDRRLGSTHQPLLPAATVGFADGQGAMAGNDRPSPRAISTQIFEQTSSIPSGIGITSFAVVFGQFLAHDLSLTPAQNASGTDIPVIGATISLDGLPDILATTDKFGFFELESSEGLPSPEFFVHIDGGTANNAPDGTRYATLGKPFHSQPGKSAQLNMNGNTFDIYLPPMAMEDVILLHSDQLTEVGFGPSVLGDLNRTAQLFPQLTALQRELLAEMRVFYPPGSARNSDGTPATLGMVIPVNPERLPAPLPPGANPSLVISVQAGTASGFNLAGGSTNFTIPAPFAFPNLDGLAPGESTNVISFDHDAGRWTFIGTATASADGRSVISDPGVGILAPGWHFLGLAQVFGGGTYNNPCEEAADKFAQDLVDAGIEVALVTSGAGAITKGLITTVQGLRDFTHDCQAGPSSECSKSLTKIAIGVANKYFGPLNLAVDLVDHYNAWSTCQFPTGGAPNNFVQTQQRYLDINRQVADAVWGSPEWSRASRDEFPAVSAFLDSIADSTDESSDGGNGITAAERQHILSLPLPLRFQTRAAELLDRMHGIATQLTVPTSFYAMLQSQSESLLAVLNNLDQLGWETTVQGFTTKPNDWHDLSAALLSLNAASRSFSVGGGAFASGNMEPGAMFTKFGVAENSLITVDYVSVARVPTNGGFFSASGNENPNVGGFIFGVAHSSVMSGGRNSCVALPKVNLRLADPTDSDSDGLPDEIEDIIGTHPERFDTNRNGISDLQEYLQGLDPDNGQNFPSGIVGGLSVNGEVYEVSFGTPRDQELKQFIYIASGTHGLAIADATRFNRPILISELDLGGIAQDIAINSNASIAIVASGDGGLQFIDVSNIEAPVWLRTINFNASQIEVVGGIVFASSTNRLYALDEISGEVLFSLVVPSSSDIVALTHDGNYLYAMDRDAKLHILETSAVHIHKVSDVLLPQGGGKIAVDNGILYAAAIGTYSRGGYVTVDINNPFLPRVISGSDVVAPFLSPGTAIVSNGSGRGLLAGAQSGQFLLDIMDLSDTENTNLVLSRISLRAAPSNLAIAAGIAYVANGTGDLTIVNYLPFDTRGQAPVVSIVGPIGNFIDEGARVPIRVQVTDDVQVRDVELLLNGQVVSRDTSAPWDLLAIAPALTSGISHIELQVRATDTGGNIGLSQMLSYDLRTDQSPPVILSSSPAPDGTGFRIPAITLRLNEPINADMLNLSRFSLLHLGDDFIPGGENDTPVGLDRIELLSPTSFVIYPQQSLVAGQFQFSIQANTVRDVAGNWISEPVMITFTNIDIRDPNTVAWISGTSGNWNDPNNWSSGRVPGPSDSVIIDHIIANPTITLNSGAVVVAELYSSENIEILSGSLRVSRPSFIDGRITLSGGEITASGVELILAGDIIANGGQVAARNGGTIIVSNAVSIEAASGLTTILSTGEDSVIEFRSLSQISPGINRGNRLMFQATSGGRISFPQVQIINDSFAGDSHGRFITLEAIGIGSAIELPQLTTFIDRNPAENLIDVGLSHSGRLRAMSGGVITVPALTEIKAVRIEVDNASLLDIGAVESMSGALLTVSGSTHQWPFAHLTNADKNSYYVYDGASITFPRIINLDAGFNLGSTWYVNGQDSKIEFPELSSLIPGANRGERLDIISISGGQVLLPKLTQVDNAPTGDLGDQYITFHASGQGSSIQLPLLTTFIDRNASFNLIDTSISRGGLLRASSGGSLIVPELRDIQGVRVEVDNQSSLDVSSLASVTIGRFTVSGSNHQWVLPNLTSANETSYLLSSGATLTLPAVSTLDAGYNFLSTWSVSGPGSQLIFPELMTMIPGADRGDQLAVNASLGGVVRLPKLISIIDPTQGDFGDRLISFVANGAGSFIDLPSLETFIDRDPNNNNISNGTLSRGGLIKAEAGGEISMPSLNHIQFVRIAVDNQSILNVAALQSALGGHFSIDGNNHQWTLASLINADQSGYTISGGASLTLPSIDSLDAGNNYVTNWYVLGENSRLSMPNLETMMPGTNRSDRLSVTASDGATIDLSGLTTITDLPSGDLHARFISFSADGLDTLINLSSLVSFADIGASGNPNAHLTASDNALISLGPMSNLVGIGISLNSSGTISGNLQLTASTRLSSSAIIGGSLVNDSTVALGNTPGLSRVTGDFTQTPAGILEIRIGGNVPSVDYGQLIVGGNAQLDGHLNISFANGFDPEIGSVYTLLRANALAGTFSNLIGLDIGNGKVMVIEYTAKEVRLITTDNN